MVSRRVRQACVVCRDRKVKCDRVQPNCGRCVRLNETCSYDTFPASTHLSRQVQDLQARLNRAEAQLSLRGNESVAIDPRLPTLRPSIADSLPSESTLLEDIPSMNHLTRQLDPKTLDMDLGQYFQLDLHTAANEPASGVLGEQSDLMAHLEPNTFLEPQQQIDSYLIISQLINDATHGIPKAQDEVTHLKSGGKEISNPLDQHLAALYRFFFNHIYNSLPILCETRFFTLLSGPHSDSISALKYGVALLSAALSIPHQHLQRELYSLVRGHIEACEMNNDSSAFSNLETFQAVLFLLRYEIMSSQITRAWMTLGRAIRLASVMNMHRIDDTEEPLDIVPGLHVALPATTDQSLVEERRRSFWLLFVLETYVRTRSGMPSQLGSSSMFKVNLPSPGRLGPDFTPLDMPYLTDVLGCSCELSSYAACLLMVDLAMKCLEHVEIQSTQSLPSGFWDRHFALTKSFQESFSMMQHHFTDEALSRDPIALTTYLNMCTIEITLHEVILERRQDQGFASAMSAESERNCQDISQRIINTMKTSWSDRQVEGSPFVLQGTFLAWSVAKAINTSIQTLAALETHPSTDKIANLRQLFSLLDELEQEESYWHVFTSDSLVKFKDSGHAVRGIGAPF